MKPGDLVRIKNNIGDCSFPVTIGSLTHETITQGEAAAGQFALLLGDFDNTSDDDAKLILIDGKVGWVWPDELEELDEAR